MKCDWGGFRERHLGSQWEAGQVLQVPDAGNTWVFSLGTSRRWGRLNSPAPLCPVPELASIHGISIFRSLCWEDALHVVQLGLLASNGQLAVTWPLSALGLPNPWVPGRCSPVAKLPRIHLIPNGGVRKPDIPSEYWGSSHEKQVNLEWPSDPLWKGFPRTAGVTSWPTACLPPLLHPVCWCDEEWCARLCAHGDNTALSKSHCGPSFSAGWVNVSIQTKHFNPGQKPQIEV